MKISVIGLGAMGSIYAALLADAGNDVWAMDPWAAHTDAIKHNGLRVQGASGDRTVTSITLTNNANDLIGTDLFIVATKASSVGDAAKMIMPAITSASFVLTIQNGLGSGERIAQYIPDKSVLLGVADGFGASVKAPGHVRHTAMKMIRIGSLVRGNDKVVQDVTQAWIDAGFNAKAFDDIAQLVWEKFICNVAYSAPCTVFEKSVRELIQDPHGLSVSQRCALEAYNVAKAKNINLSFDKPLEYIAAFAERVGDAKPSMYLDHLAKRPSEIDAINGMVPVAAQEADLTAPYNEVLTHIVRSREASWVSGACGLDLT